MNSSASTIYESMSDYDALRRAQAPQQSLLSVGNSNNENRVRRSLCGFWHSAIAYIQNYIGRDSFMMVPSRANRIQNSGAYTACLVHARESAQ